MQQQKNRTESSDSGLRDGVDRTDRTTASSHGTMPPNPTHPHHLRSCTACRTRKIKCDRQQPCCNCVKAGHDETSCVYPPGPGRAPKRSRQDIDLRLVDRLSKLEALLGSFQHQQHQQHSTPYTPPSWHGAAPPTPSTVDTSSPHSNSIEQQMGRLVMDDKRSYYVSNVLWASLGSEIEELRNMLTESASEDEDDKYSAPDSNAAMLNFRDVAHSLESYHPRLRQSVELLRVFTDNVLPLLHMFHMPTTTDMFWNAVASLNSIDKNTEALLFAIYYSAVTSTEEESGQCKAILGLSRKAAREKYRFATEQAMARANLLNTQSIVLIQAAVLFISALRNEDDTRTPWSLTGLVYHIAQAMGLHRDGAAFGMKPLETEMRRRLWYHICLLDSRAFEYYGYEPIVHEHGFDTQVPLHVNDSDLTAEMTTPPPERVEACDMTFCRIRCELMRTGWKINHAPLWVQRHPMDIMSLVERQALVTDLKSRLHRLYLPHCDGSSVPFLRLASTVTRMILARMWLTVNHPAGDPAPPSERRATSTRDQLFLTSIEVLELSAKLMTDPDMAPWKWHCETHTQWHAVAFALSEICARPPGPDCDRAWEYVCAVHDGWRVKESGRNGTLWRPIKQLMAKARYVREIQQTTRHGRPSRDVALPGVLDSAAELTTQDDLPLPFSPDENFAGRGAAEVENGITSEMGGLGGVQNAMDLEPLDQFVELLPDDWQKDLFGAAMQGTSREFNHDVMESWFA